MENTRPLKTFFLAYVILVIILDIIPIGSASELNNITVLYFRADYIIHATMFFPWAFFCVKMNKKLLLWLLWGILFAVGSEGLQYWVPYRMFNINDMLANVIGIIAGFLIFIPVLRLGRFKF